MKKFYTLILMTVVAALGFAASAAALTVTVHINDPALAQVQPYYYPGGLQDALAFDADNNYELEFPDGTYASMRYLYVTPVTPEGSEQVYFKGYKIYDCDGVLLSETTVNASGKKNITVPATADGGRVEIECGTLSNSKLNVTINGTLEKVSMNADGKKIALVLGEQQIEIAPGTKILQIKPVGVTSFYSITYNGSELKRKEDSGEGSATSYYYSVSSPADGATLVIETDYPNVKYNVAFNCNEEGFIRSVKVNGEAVESWENLSVSAGDQVSVAGDTYNYTVNSCGVDGTPASYPSYSMSAVVMANTEFFFDVTKTERSGNVVVYATKGSEWVFHTAGPQFDEPSSGYHLYGLASDDNPFYFNIQKYPEGSSDQATPYIYLNDELVSTDFGTSLTLADGDVVKGYVGTSAPASYNVSYTLVGIDEMPLVVKDLVTPVADAAGHKALPGTLITITPAEGQANLAVSVNGAALEPAEGAFSFPVEADTEVAISSTSALNTVGVDSTAGATVIYNLQGIRVASDPATLPAGIYIINGAKHRIR